MKKIAFNLFFLTVFFVQAWAQKTYKVDYEQDGFKGYVQFTVTLNSYNKGGAGSPVLYGAKDNNIVHIITSYMGGKHNAVLAKKGITFPKRLFVNTANNGAEISGRAFFYASPKKEAIHSAVNLTLSLPDGHIMPDFSTASVDYLREYYKKHNTYLWTLTGGLDQLSVRKAYFSDFKQEVERAVSAYEKEQRQQVQTTTEAASTSGQTVAAQGSTQTTTNQTSNKLGVPIGGGNTQTQSATSGQSQTSSSRQRQATNMTVGREITNTSASVDIAQTLSEYNATEKAKSDALNAATKETTSQWAQGNYIQGAKPLVDEFARQGNAAGTYGTVGVAVAAQAGAIIGDAIAARRERKAEEAAYNYELNRGKSNYYAHNYKDAFSWFYSSYEQKKNVNLSKIYMAVQMLYGKGVEKNQTLAIQILKEYAPTDSKKEIKEKGYPDAYYHLAVAYLLGEGVSRDYAKVRELIGIIQRTNNNYNGWALELRSFMSLKGLGCEKDVSAGKMYMPLLTTAKLQEKGIGYEKNIDKAYNLYVKSARYLNSLEAYYDVLRLHKEYNLDSKKLEKFLKLSEKGNYVKNNWNTGKGLIHYGILEYPDEFW